MSDFELFQGLCIYTSVCFLLFTMICGLYQVKQEELMAAEETERHKMEGLIRHRLRQISQVGMSVSIQTC